MKKVWRRAIFLYNNQTVDLFLIGIKCLNYDKYPELKEGQ